MASYVDGIMGGEDKWVMVHKWEILHWVFTLVVLVLVVLMITGEVPIKQKKVEEPKKDGLQYLGASFPVRDDTGFPNGDKIATSELQKNSFTERLVESGREPNLFTVQQEQPADGSVTVAPAAVGAASGFRDRMSNEEELAKYLNK